MERNWLVQPLLFGVLCMYVGWSLRCGADICGSLCTEMGIFFFRKWMDEELG